MATPKKTAFVAVCVLVVLAGTFSYFLRYSRIEPDREPDFAEIPYRLGEWVGEERRFEDYAYEVLAADTTTYRLYRDTTGREMSLFIAYFSSQEYGGQIHSPRHCLPGGGWAIQSREPQTLAVPGENNYTINRMRIALGEHAEYMWYWFMTRGGVNSSEYGLKWDLVINSLQLKPTDAVFIRFNTLTEATPAEAERLGEAFALELIKHLDRALPFANRSTPRDG